MFCYVIGEIVEKIVYCQVFGASVRKMLRRFEVGTVFLLLEAKMRLQRF